MKLSSAAAPFPLPAKLEPRLQRVHAYWQGLKRGQADIPFMDDVKLRALGDLGDNLMLFDVFQRPSRFRFAMVGDGIGRRYGDSLAGLFADEIVPRAPLDFLLAQCSATQEARAPTYFRSAPKTGYARILLPLWGDGHINGLLGALAF